MPSCLWCGCEVEHGDMFCDNACRKKYDDDIKGFIEDY